MSGATFETDAEIIVGYNYIPADPDTGWPETVEIEGVKAVVWVHGKPITVELPPDQYDRDTFVGWVLDEIHQAKQEQHYDEC